MHGETLAVISRKITLRRQVRNVGDILARGHIRRHDDDGRKVTIFSKKPRSLSLALGSFVPSAL